MCLDGHGFMQRTLRLQYPQPELYQDKWIESPGQFHIVLPGYVK